MSVAVAAQDTAVAATAAVGDTLLTRMVAAIGADSVIADDTQLAFYARDVYGHGGLPALAVRPASVAALQAAVKVCAAAGAAMVPRGGGASYTDGYLHAAGGHVVFDLVGLDRIQIDAANAVVTVGPGTTWRALKTALAEHGLRTPFWGPFSGLVATVGGSVSQHSVSHGSGGHGISAASVLSMDVVLASGELLRTAPTDATRHDGPDLTGLFTGDCGALGIKAAIRLRLIATRADHVALSFAFADFAAFHAGLRQAAREGLDDQHFGLDAALSQGQIGKQDGLASRLRVAAAVLHAAPTALAGVRQLLRMLAAGDRVLGSGAYMAHFIVEGCNAAEARAKAQRLRALMRAQGREIANSVPGFVRALPFAPMHNMLGPKGERWVPLHGVLPHGRVAGFHAALMVFYAERRARMDALGVWTGAMFVGVGSTGLLYELALYWRDATTPYHETVIDADHRARLPAHPANPQARAFVEAMKRELIALFDAHGAAFFQIGRVYPYASRLDPRALALVRALKATLDPMNLMNPGALGLVG